MNQSIKMSHTESINLIIRQAMTSAHLVNPQGNFEVVASFFAFARVSAFKGQEVSGVEQLNVRLRRGRE